MVIEPHDAAAQSSRVRHSRRLSEWVQTSVCCRFQEASSPELNYAGEPRADLKRQFMVSLDSLVDFEYRLLGRHPLRTCGKIKMERISYGFQTGADPIN